MFLLVAQAQSENGFWSIIDRYDTLILATISLIAVVVTAILTAKFTRINDQQRDIWLRKAQLYEEVLVTLNAQSIARHIEFGSILQSDFELAFGMDFKAIGVKAYEMRNRVRLWGDDAVFKSIVDLLTCIDDSDSSEEEIIKAIINVEESMRRDLGVMPKRRTFCRLRHGKRPATAKIT